jgi:hypothetical protein
MPVSQFQIDQAKMDHQSARSKIHSTEKFLAHHGWERCPNKECFEQERGTGCFEVCITWGVATCPCCHGEGWVTKEERDAWMLKQFSTQCEPSSGRKQSG